jgi:hypothetical protein
MLHIKYFNPLLNIGLVSYREAWDLSGQYPEKYFTEVYRGKLVFRMHGSTKRITYQRVKKGLLKKEIYVRERPLPF